MLFKISYCKYLIPKYNLGLILSQISGNLCCSKSIMIKVANLNFSGTWEFPSWNYHNNVFSFVGFNCFQNCRSKLIHHYRTQKYQKDLSFQCCVIVCIDFMSKMFRMISSLYFISKHKQHLSRSRKKFHFSINIETWKYMKVWLQLPIEGLQFFEGRRFFL